MTYTSYFGTVGTKQNLCFCFKGASLLAAIDDARGTAESLTAPRKSPR
jgi:hypothetical protein